MTQPAQSSRQRRVPSPVGLVGSVAAAMLLGALPGLLGVPTGCGGQPGGPLPAVSTGPIPAAPPRNAAARPEPVPRKALHVVEPGETLWEIGRNYGVSIPALMRENDIRPREVKMLRVGRALRIPAAAGRAAAPVHRPVPTAGRPAPLPPRRVRAAAPSTALLAIAHLGQARDRYEAADFEGALEDAREASRLLRQLEDAPDVRSQRARASLVQGMAEAALGDSADALASFREARRLEPGLSLDPTTTSPKLMALFEQAGVGP